MVQSSHRTVGVGWTSTKPWADMFAWLIAENMSEASTFGELLFIPCELAGPEHVNGEVVGGRPGELLGLHHYPIVLHRGVQGGSVHMEDRPMHHGANCVRSETTIWLD